MGVVKMSDIGEKIINTPERAKRSITMDDIRDRGTVKQAEIVFAPNRKVSDVLSQGQWKGKRCFVVAGGESVNRFDLKLIENEHTIAVNLAFRLFTPEIILATDARLWGWIEQNETGDNDKKTFDECPAIKIWSDLNTSPLPEDIVIAHAVAGGKLSNNLKDGVAFGTNSGFGALNLALLMGASEIYLIGFDFYGDRWHKGYPEPSQTGNDYHLECFRENGAEFKEFSSKIINLNPDSKLDLFEFGEMPKDLKREKVVVKEEPKRVASTGEPIFVSFFTKDNGYQEFGNKLRASLDRLGLENDIQAIKSKGNWDKNTKFKPEYIQKMLDKHAGRPVVWLDADALVNEIPKMLMKCEADLAVHIRKDGELISSVMYFSNNEATRSYLRKVQQLIDSGEKHPYGEQIFFQRALNESLATWALLPEEYCWIVGISDADMKNVVIEQHQASRTLKQ